MNAKKAVMLAGLAALAVALLLGFSPVRSQGRSCGSAWGGADRGVTLGGIDDCGDARSSRNTLAWAAIIVGGVLFVGGAMIGRNESSAPSSP